MKLNNKGLSIIEVVVTFTLIMLLSVSLLYIIVNYRNSVSISLERLELDTLKNNITQDINKDLLDSNLGGLKEIKPISCPSGIGLNRCINIIFNNGSEKIFGTSYVLENDRNSVLNKFLYYDGLKYKIKDSLPKTKPENRKWIDMQEVSIEDAGMLDTSYTVLEDGTKVYVYSINVSITHIDFDEDFGVHIVASTDKIGL